MYFIQTKNQPKTNQNKHDRLFNEVLKSPPLLKYRLTISCVGLLFMAQLRLMKFRQSLTYFFIFGLPNFIKPSIKCVFDGLIGVVFTMF